MQTEKEEKYKTKNALYWKMDHKEICLNEIKSFSLVFSNIPHKFNLQKDVYMDSRKESFFIKEFAPLASFKAAKNSSKWFSIICLHIVSN